MIGALLKLVFLAFLFCVIVVAIVAYRIVKSFWDVKKTFGSQTNRHFYGNCSDNDEDVVVDNRNKKAAKKKIFDKDEGEYVDFEEE